MKFCVRDILCNSHFDIPAQCTLEWSHRFCECVELIHPQDILLFHVVMMVVESAV